MQPTPARQTQLKGKAKGNSQTGAGVRFTGGGVARGNQVASGTKPSQDLAKPGFLQAIAYQDDQGECLGEIA